MSGQGRRGAHSLRGALGQALTTRFPTHRGLHDGACAAGVPAAAALPALPLLQQPAPCRRGQRLQGSGLAHGEQHPSPIHGSQDPAVRFRAGPRQAGGTALACPGPQIAPHLWGWPPPVSCLCLFPLLPVPHLHSLCCLPLPAVSPSLLRPLGDLGIDPGPCVLEGLVWVLRGPPATLVTPLCPPDSVLRWRLPASPSQEPITPSAL